MTTDRGNIAGQAKFRWLAWPTLMGTIVLVLGFWMGWGVSVWLAVVGIIVGLLGVVMAIYPPQTKGIRWAYLLAFICCGLFVLMLTVIQERCQQRSEKANGLIVSNLTSELTSLRSNFNSFRKRTIPQMPWVQIETLEGSPTSKTNDGTMTFARLMIRNRNPVPIVNVRSRIQLPEPVITESCEVQQTAGTSVGWRPLLMKLRVSGSGGRSQGGLWIGPRSAIYPEYPAESFSPPAGRSWREEISGEGDLTGVWELTADRLPPDGYVIVTFATSNSRLATNYLRFVGETMSDYPPKSAADPKELNFFMEGDYQFEAESQPGRQYFLLPITYDRTERKMRSLETQNGTGGWRPVTLNLY